MHPLPRVTSCDPPRPSWSSECAGTSATSEQDHHHPYSTPLRLLLHLHLLPRNPSLLRNPRGSSWRLPKTSARERFSRHERGSLRTTDGEDIHGREDLHDDFRAYATLNALYARHARTNSRTHAMPAAAGNGCARSPSHQAAIAEAL